MNYYKGKEDVFGTVGEFQYKNETTMANVGRVALYYFSKSESFPVKQFANVMGGIYMQLQRIHQIINNNYNSTYVCKHVQLPYNALHSSPCRWKVHTYVHYNYNHCLYDQIKLYTH